MKSVCIFACLIGIFGMNWCMIVTPHFATDEDIVYLRRFASREKELTKDDFLNLAKQISYYRESHYQKFMQVCKCMKKKPSEELRQDFEYHKSRLEILDDIRRKIGAQFTETCIAKL